mgnify:FL=1
MRNLDFSTKVFRLLMLVLLLFSVQISRADEGWPRTLKGRIVDAKSGETLIGVNIQILGTTTGTISDFDGGFQLVVKANSVIQFSYVGYKPIEIKAEEAVKKTVFQMEEDAGVLEEVVVVGYGKKKKSNVAGATAKINLKAKEKYKTPQPVIGKRKYKKYLEENLIRPNDESCKDVKGEVVLSFFVDKEGRPQNITVVHGLCESADKEAIRLVKEGPKWTSGDLPTRVTVEF